MLRNAATSVVQVVLLGVTLFLLYRFLLNTIGAEQFGIWSVVLATTSVTNIAGFGLSGSVVKFVAKYAARGEDEVAANVIQTAALSIGLVIGIFLAVAYPLLSWILSLVIPENSLDAAISILPYGLASFWIMAVARVFQGGLDGYQRIDLRSMLLMGTAIFHLIICYSLVPSNGLLGLAYAQVAQAITLLVANYFFLKRRLGLLPVIPYRWSRPLFGEMVGYGVNFQIVSIAQMVYDPLTKALLTSFSGLTAVAYYEMASRMILQLRALPLAANQVLVPAIAELQEKNAQFIQAVYKDSYHFVLYLSLPLYSAIIGFTPVVSEIWIGRYESTFVLYSTLLAIGWFLNTLAGPAYFANLGTGEVSWNTISHLVTGVANVLFGLLLGSLYGGTAVVAAGVVSLITGSWIMIFSYHYRHNIPLRELLPLGSNSIALASVIGLLAVIWTYYQLGEVWRLPGVTAVMIIIFSAIVVVPAWLHPIRKRFHGWITIGLLKT